MQASHLQRGFLLGSIIQACLFIGISEPATAQPNGNLLLNGNFATDLSGWTIDGEGVTWASRDSAGNPDSGSMHFEPVDLGVDARPAGTVGGTIGCYSGKFDYVMEARFSATLDGLFHPERDLAAITICWVLRTAAGPCTGFPFNCTFSYLGPFDDEWHLVRRRTMSTDTQEPYDLRVEVVAIRDPGDSFDFYVDDVRLIASQKNAFWDDFETGDFAQWSTAWHSP